VASKSMLRHYAAIHQRTEKELQELQSTWRDEIGVLPCPRTRWSYSRALSRNGAAEIQELYEAAKMRLHLVRAVRFDRTRVLAALRVSWYKETDKFGYLTQSEMRWKVNGQSHTASIFPMTIGDDVLYTATQVPYLRLEVQRSAICCDCKQKWCRDCNVIQHLWPAADVAQIPYTDRWMCMLRFTLLQLKWGSLGNPHTFHLVHVSRIVAYLSGRELEAREHVLEHQAVSWYWPPVV